MKKEKTESLLELIQRTGEAVRLRRKTRPFRIGADNDWERRRTSYQGSSATVSNRQTTARR